MQRQAVYDTATLSLVICQMGEGGAKAPGEGSAVKEIESTMKQIVVPGLDLAM